MKNKLHTAASLPAALDPPEENGAQRPVIRRPDEEALLRVLERTRGSVAGVILLLAWTAGLTADEIHDLKWEDLSFERREITLPDRTVPMDDALRTCLQARRVQVSAADCLSVVTSDCRRVPMHRVYISKALREALSSEETLQDITLKDLRNDFVIRRLSRHDWAYVAQISGLSLRTLRSRFADCVPLRPEAEEAAPDLQKLQALILREGHSPAALALMMVLDHGLTLADVVPLTWAQADLDAGILCLPAVHLTMEQRLTDALREVRAGRTPDMDPHLLLTPRSHRPYEEARLYQVVQDALIRGGADCTAIRRQLRPDRQAEQTDRLLQNIRESGSITRGGAAALLGVSPNSAWYKLRQLTRQGDVVRLGTRYFPKGSVVEPEAQYEALRNYLEATGVSTRQVLAELLRLEPRQCGDLLRSLVDAGLLGKHGQMYFLPNRFFNYNFAASYAYHFASGLPASPAQLQDSRQAQLLLNPGDRSLKDHIRMVDRTTDGHVAVRFDLMNLDLDIGHYDLKILTPDGKRMLQYRTYPEAYPVGGRPYHWGSAFGTADIDIAGRGHATYNDIDPRYVGQIVTLQFLIRCKDGTQYSVQDAYPLIQL